MPRRGSDWERADSAPGKPNFYHAALLQPISPRKLPEWLATLKDALTAKCCVGDASGERGAAQ